MVFYNSAFQTSTNEKLTKTAALTNDTVTTSAPGKETAKLSASLVKFMERSAFPSRILTDQEFDDKMTELRTLAGKVDRKKLITLYGEKMLTNYCEACSVKCHGPTTMLDHFVSRYHCDMMQNCALMPAKLSKVPFRLCEERNGFSVALFI
ncbi:unnamed protein product [Cylicostephanus goldi]|uniref:Uncharacterized protein n=1 Tax=Cylicostephanus goldi TaxID=71465 RepID=A0A3P7PMF7_CYLGO|nr:unnamed protein product [Cylicostephanus goldi]